MVAHPRKLAVVIGAAGALGSAVAARLAPDMRLVAADLDGAKVAQLASDLSANGAEVMPAQLDLSKSADVQGLADRVVERFGPVDLVCNTVGISTNAGDRTWAVPLEDWERIMAVNFWGALNVIRSFVPLLLANNHGHILNTASTTAFSAPMSRFSAYITSKHAVVSVSEVLQQDLRAVGSRVRVSVIIPGAIGSTDAAARPEISASDLARHATRPEELAERIVDAVDTDNFYIFCRDEDVTLARSRLAGIVSRVLPQPPPLVLPTAVDPK